VLGSDIAGALPPGAALPPHLVSGSESDVRDPTVPPSFIPSSSYARESAPPETVQVHGTPHYGRHAAAVPGELYRSTSVHPYHGGLHTHGGAGYHGAAHPGGFFVNGGMFRAGPEAPAATFIGYGPNGPMSMAGAAVTGAGAVYGGVHAPGAPYEGPPAPLGATPSSPAEQPAGVARAGDAFPAHTWGPPSDRSNDESPPGSPMRTDSMPLDPALFSQTVNADFVDAHGRPLEMNLVEDSMSETHAGSAHPVHGRSRGGRPPRAEVHAAMAQRAASISAAAPSNHAIASQLATLVNSSAPTGDLAQLLPAVQAAIALTQAPQLIKKPEGEHGRRTNPSTGKKGYNAQVELLMPDEAWVAAEVCSLLFVHA
jgi:hypothetical protein